MSPLVNDFAPGGDAARAVGMALTPSRIALLALAACLTATATMTIGPLSFVGLMAPHIARMLGFRRTMPHMVIRRWQGRFTGLCRLVRQDGAISVSDPGGTAFKLYWRAVFYLFAT